MGLLGGWAGLALWAAVRLSPRGRRAAIRGGRRGMSSQQVVWLALVAVLVGGGGRRWLQARRARRAVARLAEPGVNPDEVLAVADHGREGLIDLFRLLGTAPEPATRDAAGRALARLWKRDELIAEEEKAIVTRGFSAQWRARRKYPRGLRGPIPISASYGVSFLRDDDGGVTPGQLEWSHRVAGSERASLETPSDWRPGPGVLAFDLDPGDFAAQGPHRLVLEAKARPLGLTSSWEAAPPHVPFTFEFDPHLAVEALLGQADDARAATFAGAVRLEMGKPGDEGPTFLPVDDRFALRDPPRIVVNVPLPGDLAHSLAIEFEGVAGRFPAGAIVVTGPDQADGIYQFAIGPIRPPDGSGLEHVGDARMRAILTPDPHLGWADPGVRSIWPEPILTEWVAVKVVRQ